MRLPPLIATTRSRSEPERLCPSRSDLAAAANELDARPPTLLDLFCGAGGTAMGYARAGFTVVGIDIEPQPHYPFEFIQADALRPPVELQAFDLIHASPPCQAYSAMRHLTGVDDRHPRLIPTVREILLQSGRPFVIENVEGARNRLHDPLRLCGSMFGIAVRRHRYFECHDSPLILSPPCDHAVAFLDFRDALDSEYRAAMECEWMTTREARQAIPPAYTEWIGRAIRRDLPLGTNTRNTFPPPAPRMTQ